VMFEGIEYLDNSNLWVLLDSLHNDFGLILFCSILLDMPVADNNSQNRELENNE
jgi:hypothetical protein